MSLTSEYSGVIINQNAAPTTVIEFGKAYQNFKLPENFRYGSEPGQHRYPELSGFQVQVKVLAGQLHESKIEYSLEYHVFGAGWKTLASGTSGLCHTAAEKVWMDVYFDNPIPITADIAESEFRFKFKTHGIRGFWAVQPARAQMPSYAEEELLELLDSTFDFRLLALVADSGTDFLGNPYRSIVVTKSLDNTDTINPNKGYWRSSPQPSKFAVVSNYFDVRFDPGDRYGDVNLLSNPSFEYDKVGDFPAEWKEFIGAGGAAGSIQVSDTWADNGIHSAHFKSANLTNKTVFGGMWGAELKVPVKYSKGPYQLYFQLNLISRPTGGSVGVSVSFENEGHEGLGGGASSYEEIESDIHGLTVGVVPPLEKDVAFIKIKIYCEKANGVFEWYADSFALSKVRTEGVEYFDGDTENNEWLGSPGHSASVKTKPGAPEEAVVIDGVMLDPQTPNVAFNVYCSSDGDADETTTTKEWEQKLWARVPRTYVATQRQSYVFPSPITAKYIKIEYSHLQPQSYNPGDFQAPVTYKKFPKWVTSLFLNQLELPSFVAKRVGVSYDALSFAYEYFLDDLHQRPDGPATHQDEETINRFFAQSDAASLVDTVTLQKINLTLNNFTFPPALQGSLSTLLGNQAKRVAQLQTNYPVEYEPTQTFHNLTSVSTAERENIVIEESTPVMYFYLTCRHAYKELSTSFENNRAYFAGVNEIAFLRNSYTAEADSEVYIESGADTENLDTNDFVINEDGSWSIV